MYYLIISSITKEVTLCKRFPAHPSQINTIIYYHNPWNIFELMYQHFYVECTMSYLFILYTFYIFHRHQHLTTAYNIRQP